MHWELNLLFEIMKLAPLLISLGNLILLIIILYIYWSRNHGMHSRLNSIAVFLTFFVVQNFVFVVYFIFNIPNNLNVLMAPIIFLGFEFIVFLQLLKLTWNEARLDLENDSSQHY